MPYATLLKPASLRIGGLTFEQHVRTPVTKKLAEALEINPRFRVEHAGDDEDGAADVTGLKPSTPRHADPIVTLRGEEEPRSDVPVEKIAEAIDALDVDDEDAYLDSGKPNPEAVSRIVGEPVTAADIDAVLAKGNNPPGRGPTATAAEIESKRAVIEGHRPVALKLPRKQKPVGGEDDTAGAVEM